MSSDAMRCALIGCGEMILLADGKNPKQLIIVMSKMNAYMLLQMATINNVYIYTLIYIEQYKFDIIYMYNIYISVYAYRIALPISFFNIV